MQKESCGVVQCSSSTLFKFSMISFQVQNYSPKVLKKYTALPTDIETFFREDVTGIVSNKLPGYQESELR